MIIQNKKISTDISLHLLEENMADEIFNLVDNNRQHLGAWFPWVEKTLSPADSLVFIQHIRTQWQAKKSVVFWVRANGIGIGTVGFHFLNSDTEHTQIGYWLAKSAEGQGFMQQAVKLMIHHFFEHYDRDCLEIHCDRRNQRSQNVALNLGFSHQKTLFNAVASGSDWVVDFEVYMLTRTEWCG